MLTKRYPMVQFKKDTWEIDEFDVASIFLLVGTEKAMVIDCGMGIGDLRGAIEMITDKPLIAVISHGHIDHTGNGRQFKELWIHPNDQGPAIPQSLERRRFDTSRIAQRQKGCIGAPYTMFNLYPYDINEDLREPAADEPAPVLRDLRDGQTFDLGGGRVVTAYECPGHSAGEMVFLDEATRTLFAGDAINFNLGLGACPIETALRYLRRVEALKDRYDDIYNGHHDFRPLGDPLDPECLPTIIAMCEDILKGAYAPVTEPSPWGSAMPLTRGAKGPANVAMPANPDHPAGPAGAPKRVTIQRGRNFIGFDENNLFDPKP